MLDITVHIDILQFLECYYDQIKSKNLGEKVQGKAFASKDSEEKNSAIPSS